MIGKNNVIVFNPHAISHYQSGSDIFRFSV